MRNKQITHQTRPLIVTFVSLAAVGASLGLPLRAKARSIQMAGTDVNIPRLGADFGLFYPLSARTRARFGDVWSGFSVGIGPVPNPQTGGHFGPHFGLLHRSGSGNYVWVAPVGIQYEAAIGHGNTLKPFIGGSADANFIYLYSSQDHIRPAVHLSPGVSLYAGVDVGENAYVRGTYSLSLPVEGFNFSGMGASIGVRF